MLLYGDISNYIDLYVSILYGSKPDLDSRLAHPRPRPRLGSFKTKTKTKTCLSKTKTKTQQFQDQDQRFKSTMFDRQLQR